MRMQQCSFMVEEELRPNERCLRQIDIAQTISRLPDHRRRVLRLTFFKSKRHQPIGAQTREEALHNWERDWHSFRQLFKDPASDLKCLGFLYLYTDYAERRPQSSHVHAAVIASDNLESPNKYIHSSPMYTGCIHDLWFPVVGSYFAQQDTFVSCCYHTALMVCLKNIYSSLNLECPATYEKMNEIVGIDYLERKVKDGLTPEEALLILDELLNKPLRCTAEAINSADYGRPNEVIAEAYHTVESALPSVINFYNVYLSGKPMKEMGHAMAVVGHTFEAGLWQYHKGKLSHCEWPRYLGTPYQHHPSHLWAEELVIQDEASGPYCTLPWHALIDRSPGVIIPRFGWAGRVYPQQAQLAAQSILNRGGETSSPFLNAILHSNAAPVSEETNPWFFEVKRHVESHKDDMGQMTIPSYVLRTVPCTPQRYLEFLCQLASPELCRIIESDLGDAPFWLVEISVPHLFQWNNARLGEIIVPVSTSPSDLAHVYLVRLPGVLTLFEEDGSYTHYKIAGDYHYALQTKELMPLKELLSV